ncbi:hypothetical protein F5Y03DRAFT_290565 [Xylaria venustula]|nr:hypothetical protein F5Y03DRAFT_290565 [Xylaria venustula]
MSATMSSLVVALRGLRGYLANVIKPNGCVGSCCGGSLVCHQPSTHLLRFILCCTSQPCLPSTIGNLSPHLHICRSSCYQNL